MVNANDIERRFVDASSVNQFLAYIVGVPVHWRDEGANVQTVLNDIDSGFFFALKQRQTVAKFEKVVGLNTN